MLLESFIITEFTSLLAHPLSTNHPLRICKVFSEEVSEEGLQREDGPYSNKVSQLRDNISTC